MLHPVRFTNRCVAGASIRFVTEAYLCWSVATYDYQVRGG